MKKKKTDKKKQYRAKVGGHLGNERFEAGAILTLTPEQEKALLEMNAIEEMNGNN